MDDFVKGLNVISIAANKYYDEDTETTAIFAILTVAAPEIPTGYELQGDWTLKDDGTYQLVIGEAFTAPEGD